MLLASLLLSLPVFAQDYNPYDDIGYVNNDWLFPYAMQRQEMLTYEGMRLVTSMRPDGWVNEKHVPLPDAYDYEGQTYVRVDNTPVLLGNVREEYLAQQVNQLLATDHSEGSCYPVIVINWDQDDGCRTPFYKKSAKNVYEPLTCEDQGITKSFATSSKAYYLVLFSYCVGLVPSNNQLN